MIELFEKVVLGIATFALAFTFFASSAHAANITVSPWVYDPDSACPGILSMWDYSTGFSAPSLHLTKPCTTATNAASGATFLGVAGMTLTELNFDYRSDGHCGAGAPRFNVDASDGFHFMGGCSNGTSSSTSDPNWTHVVIDPTNAAQAFPVLTPGATINSIDVVFDEGTDTAGGTPGSVYLDNFSVNGQVVGGPTKQQQLDSCKKDGWKNYVSAPGPFKNQGDCVSFFATKGKNPGNG